MIMLLRERKLPGKVIWQFSMNLLTRLDVFNAAVALRKIVRRREAVLISARVGSGRVPSAISIQSAEIAIYIGNNLGCLGRLEILCGPRDSPRAIRIRRSFMIPEHVLPCSPNKDADSVFYRAEQSLTPSGDAPNEVRRVSIVRAIHPIHSER